MCTVKEITSFLGHSSWPSSRTGLSIGNWGLPLTTQHLRVMPTAKLSRRWLWRLMTDQKWLTIPEFQYIMKTHSSRDKNRYSCRHKEATMHVTSCTTFWTLIKMKLCPWLNSITSSNGIMCSTHWQVALTGSWIRRHSGRTRIRYSHYRKASQMNTPREHSMSFRTCFLYLPLTLNSSWLLLMAIDSSRNT